MQEIGATGLLEWTWGWGWWWTVDSVVAWAGISVDNTDPANPIVTNIATWGSPAGADTEIQYNDAWAFWASSDFVFNDTTKVFQVKHGWDNLLLVSAAAGDYWLGDLDGIGNNTRFFIDDTIKVASIAAGWDRIRLNIDGTAFTAKLWDVDSIGNDTVLTVDDANYTINLAATDWLQSNNLFVNNLSAWFNVFDLVASDSTVFSAIPTQANITTTDFSSQDQAIISTNGSGAAFIQWVNGSTFASWSVFATKAKAELRFDTGLPLTTWVIVNATNLRIGNYDASGNSTLITVDDANRKITVNNRFETDKGADIAAANNLTLGWDWNLFVITGNTQINAITTANRQAGSMITLIFTGTPTVKHNTAWWAGTAVLFLAGSVDLTAAANTVLCLIYDGTQWQETSRKVA